MPVQKQQQRAAAVLEVASLQHPHSGTACILCPQGVLQVPHTCMYIVGCIQAAWFVTGVAVLGYWASVGYDAQLVRFCVPGMSLRWHF